MVFQPGCKPGPGRPAGLKDKITRLREEILRSFRELNRKYAGEGGYLMHLAEVDPKSYNMLLAKMLPQAAELDITSTDMPPVVISLRPLTQVQVLEPQPATPALPAGEVIDVDPVECQVSTSAGFEAESGDIAEEKGTESPGPGEPSTTVESSQNQDDVDARGAPGLRITRALHPLCTSDAAQDAAGRFTPPPT